MLSGMRDTSGGPKLRVRLLALLVALLLGAPLTAAVLRGLEAALRLAW